MKSHTAVAWEAGKPLVIEEVEVAGPKNGEVLLKVAATGVCHTDAYTLSGKDPEGLFSRRLSSTKGGLSRASPPFVFCTLTDNVLLSQRHRP